MNPTCLQDQSIKTPLFSLKGQVYVAKCVKCYDADTVHVVIELTKGTYSRFCCRLSGIDTAEIRTKNPAEKKHACAARDYLKGMVMNKLVLVQCGDFDKYGRLLITLYYYEGQDPSSFEAEWEDSLNSALVEKCYAYRYNGGKKKCFQDWFTDHACTI